MIVVQQERFGRLLRWYPRSWRQSNGDVLLATMLDEAERTGRTAPSAAERWSALGHGLGTRLDARLALRAALVALGVAAVAGAVAVWAIEPLGQAGAAWVLQALIALCAWLVAVGGVALLRQRGLITEPLAVVLVVLSLLALAHTAMTQVGWGAAFDAADESTTATGLGTVWPGLLIAAYILGAAALALLVEALLRQPLPRAVARAALALLCGALLAPSIGIAVLSPYPPAVGAATLALLALIPVRAARRASRSAVPIAAARPAAAVPERTRRTARLLAAVSAFGSAPGIVFALTGSGWAGAVDGTTAMGQGITIALASGLPLLAAVGMLVAARRRHRAAHTWGPLLLAALALAAIAVAYRSAPSWAAMAPGLAVASALSGAALAWWLAPRLRASVTTRIPVAVLIGLAYAAFVGMLAGPMLAFATPLIAIAVGVGATRRRPHPADSAVGAQPAGAVQRA